MLELRNLKKEYTSPGGQIINAVNDVSLQFEDKGMVFLLGKSGSGKSTMLNIIGGLDRADSGEVIVKGRNSRDFTAADFDSYRNTFIGFVFQEYNILDEYTIEENIALALKLQGQENNAEQVNDILRKVGLEDSGKRFPNTLSGGQKQRVAIARALIKDPEIIMADEPTGALDSKTGAQILGMLKELSKNKLVIVISHDRDFAEKYADRIIELSDGRVISDVSKVEKASVTISPNVEIIDNKVAVINNVQEFSKEEFDAIKRTFAKDGKQAIITADVDGVEEIKKSYGIVTENGKKSYAKTYSKTSHLKIKEYSEKDAEFIKSKLPARDAFKMGMSGLKAKPIRLAFTIFLSVIAFCLFGIMSTLMLYSPAYTMSKALNERNFQSIVLNKNYSYEEQEITIDGAGNKVVTKSTASSANVMFSQDDIDTMNVNNQGLHYVGVFNLESAERQASSRGFEFTDPKFSTERNEYYSVKGVFGFSDCGEEQLLKTGATLLAGKYPEEGHEIAISEYVFDMFNDATNFTINGSYEALLDKFVELDGTGFVKSMQIVGIYRISDLSEYEQYKAKPTAPDVHDPEFNSKFEVYEKAVATRKEKINELKKYVQKSMDTIAFVSPKFYDQTKDSITVIKPAVPPSINIKGIVVDVDAVSDANFNTPSKELACRNLYTDTVVNYYKNRFSFYDFEGNPIDLALEDDQVLISKLVYKGFVDSGMSAEEIKARPFRVKNSQGVVTRFNIVGYYDDGGISGRTDKGIVKESVINKIGKVEDYNVKTKITDYVQGENPKYNFVVTMCDNTEAQLNSVLISEGDMFTGLVNDEYDRLFSKDILDLIDQIRDIFIVGAVVVGIFAGLMLLNFISASITAKRKEIGILRAVGARSIDVFKIFFAEAFILALICFVIASALGYVVCIIINNVIYDMSTLYLLKYSIPNVLMILVISFTISFLATIIPVSKEAKRSPVESIRQL